VVSNRGPVSFSRNERGELTAKRGGGGLVTALRGLVALHEVTWIASAISDEDHALAGEVLEETARVGSPFRLRLVAHDAQAYYWISNGVSYPVVWFMQHPLSAPAKTP